jgi:hypothetical protein
MFSWLRKLRIGMLHATYHRNLKKADIARKQQDVLEFKKYVYKAEDAWRKLVILTEKSKK